MKALSRKYDIVSGLEMKIALGNYRMFFTPSTEDYFHRDRSDTPAQIAEAGVRAEKMKERNLKKLEEFIKSKIGDVEEDKEDETMEVEGTTRS